MKTRLLSPNEADIELSISENKNFIFSLSDDTLFQIISYFNNETTFVRFAISCKYLDAVTNRYMDTEVKSNPELKEMRENINNLYNQFIKKRKKDLSAIT